MTTFFRYLYLAILIVLTACSKNENPGKKNDYGQADSVAFASMKERNLEKMLAVVDSLEGAGNIDERHADFLRARGCDMCWKVGLARYYYSKAFLSYTKPIEDWDGYVETGYRLSVMRMEQHDYEGALGVATQLILEAEQEPRFPQQYYAYLLTNVASCQVELLQYDEARRNYLKGYDLIKRLTDEGEVGYKRDLLIMSIGVCGAFLKMGDYDEASTWLQRSEEALANYADQGEPNFIDEYKGHIAIAKATIEYAQGNTARANEIFDAIPENQIQVPRSVAEASRYLMLSGRYADAMKSHAWLDSLYNKDCNHTSFGEIINDMVPRFEAKMKAGNEQEALELAEKICTAIGTAVDNSYRDNSQDLSILFGLHERELTQEKETFEKNVWRIVALCAILLAVVFCVGFWLYRRRGKELKEKSYELADSLRKLKMKTANEEVTEEEPNAEPPVTEEAPAANIQTKNNKREEFLQNLYFRLCDKLDQEKTFVNPDLKREDLAAMLGTNYKYVGDAIRKCTSGMSINEFLNMKRLEYAIQLLEKTNMSIIQVSDAVGFNNRTYFNRLFREYYKMTPSEFRKLKVEGGRLKVEG